MVKQKNFDISLFLISKLVYIEEKKMQRNLYFNKVIN